jgi:hypothetical protein
MKVHCMSDPFTSKNVRHNGTIVPVRINVRHNGTVVPVRIKRYSIRCMGERMHRSMFYWPWNWLEVSDQFHGPATLPPRERTPVPTGQEAGWAPKVVRTIWRCENSWLYQDLNPDTSPSLQPVAIPTALQWHKTNANRAFATNLLVCRKVRFIVQNATQSKRVFL